MVNGQCNHYVSANFENNEESQVEEHSECSAEYKLDYPDFCTLVELNNTCLPTGQYYNMLTTFESSVVHTLTEHFFLYVETMHISSFLLLGMV